MAELTKEEKAWVKKVNALLAKCPSDRIGFYTVGDTTVFLFDVTRIDDVTNAMDSGSKDFGQCVEDLDAGFDESLRFPESVESVAG
ncbi:hypothetical protein J5069_08690 [Candidatus Symbiopectobacterium sp. NZEC127]|uniref:hypothetical protein n=1 Tax=Candidatus Symbiopectobacterium sp. NZEC127 TaxID=2820472 RepID=UPI0022279546|nr:hypothetical protein [Candidatus Symbiopectobacterium sp. NZEC127]MCW2485971.1 hypothetical protein [Candidatus Symbiopectobacterium sp. NZEC127]